MKSLCTICKSQSTCDNNPAAFGLNEIIEDCEWYEPADKHVKRRKKFEEYKDPSRHSE